MKKTKKYEITKWSFRSKIIYCFFNEKICEIIFHVGKWRPITIFLSLSCFQYLQIAFIFSPGHPRFLNTMPHSINMVGRYLVHFLLRYFRYDLYCGRPHHLRFIISDCPTITEPGSHLP